MPELPEVECIRRTLAPRVAGRRIRSVQILSPLCAGGRAQELASAVAGRRIVRLARHGKHLLFELDTGVMDIHPRMTGRLLAEGTVSRHTRAVFNLDGGDLLFDDVRQFGRIRYLENAEDLGLGPDALGLPLERFVEMAAARRGRIKPLLLNQEAIAGIGNIYADEALHRARIHPAAGAARLSRARLARLHEAIQSTLHEAIEAGGSSISDYVDAEGRQGRYQAQHRVYGRAGEACRECAARIRRMVLNQRATHFCPRCQRY